MYFRPYLCVFHLSWVLNAPWGVGSPKALVHTTLMHFFTVDSSTIEVFKTYFLILWSSKTTIQGERSMF